MAKRSNRVRPIKHEIRQIENIKALEPNTTPVKYSALSSRMIDIAIAALDAVRALEIGDAIDFEQFYDLVDGLEDTLKSRAAAE